VVGIYKITNPTNKIYIGQSWDIEKRIKSHKKQYNKNQSLLNSSISKYGVDNHIFEIAHILPQDIDQKTLDVFEIAYWQQYKDCGFSMLNIREPGNGGKLSESTKELLRLHNLGKSYTEDTNKKKGSKKEKNPCFGKFGKDHPAYGRKRTEEEKNKVQDFWTNEKKLERSKKYKAKNPNAKQVSQYTKSGEFIKNWNNIKEAANSFTSKSLHIGDVCSGKRKYAGGYIWKYNVQ